LDGVFEKAINAAKNRIIMYTNADIIFLQSLLSAIDCVKKQFPNFLIIGRRLDLDIPSTPNLGDLLQRNYNRGIGTGGTLHGISGLDYFVFTKDMDVSMPPFIVGRPRWDNNFVTLVKGRGYPIIDATEIITAIHQNHDFSHIEGGFHASRFGEEAEYNKRVGGNIAVSTVIDATHQLLIGGILREA
jgi:hypothetical protein